MKVSVITPTNRPEDLLNILTNFKSQDYLDKELIIISTYRMMGYLGHNIKVHYTPEPLTIGAARNLACSLATGEFIAHMDGDDWYAPTWLSTAVNALTNSPKSIFGLKTLHFYQLDQLLYKWDCTQLLEGHARDYVAGATMVYTKATWEKTPFVTWCKCGEDDYFTRDNKNNVLYGKDEDILKVIAMLHKNHTDPDRYMLLTTSPQFQLIEDFKFIQDIIEPHKYRFLCQKTSSETPD